MKKILGLIICVLAVCLSSCALADVEINEINFPDENFRNYVIGKLAGGRYYLTDEEARETHFIRCETLTIQSLKGVEYFTALTDLYCDNNQLTALDISKNTELRRLSCQGNQIKMLDVSKCCKLNKLVLNNERSEIYNES